MQNLVPGGLNQPIPATNNIQLPEQRRSHVFTGSPAKSNQTMTSMMGW